MKDIINRYIQLVCDGDVTVIVYSVLSVLGILLAVVMIKLIWIVTNMNERE